MGVVNGVVNITWINIPPRKGGSNGVVIKGGIYIKKTTTSVLYVVVYIEVAEEGLEPPTPGL